MERSLKGSDPNTAQIEESFRDIKSHRVGFSVSESLTRNQARLEILLLSGALATFFAWMMGMFVELKQWHRQYQSSSIKTQRVLSTFLSVAKSRKWGSWNLINRNMKWRYYKL